MTRDIDPRIISIATRYGVSKAHSEQALAEAAEFSAASAIDNQTLDDLTQLPFVTIDNEDSLDLDQALYISTVDSGFEVQYALADASFFVRPGTALFAEALERGASFYLPSISYPMLPRSLSEGLVSLNPDVTRRALVMRMTLDANGRCTEMVLSRARIRSVAKLTYAGVQGMYDGDSTLTGQPYTKSLLALRTVGLLRMAAARARHVVRYDRGPRYDVEQYNAEISLLCNAEGAQLLAKGANKRGVDPVFRAHSRPPEPRLADFARLTVQLAAVHRLDDRWRWRPDTPLADYLESLPKRDAPRVARAIHRQAVMTNVRSMYQAEVGAHYGVGVAAYARFSAPMREIVGIFTHKEAMELLGAEPATDDTELRKAIIRAGNQSKQLQSRLNKEAERLVIEDLLRGDMGRPAKSRPWRRGTVMGLVPSRIYVQLDESQLELKVYRPKHSRQPAPTIGASIELRVRKYQERSRRWSFETRNP